MVISCQDRNVKSDIIVVIIKHHKLKKTEGNVLKIDDNPYYKEDY